MHDVQNQRWSRGKLMGNVVFVSYSNPKLDNDNDPDYKTYYKNEYRYTSKIYEIVKKISTYNLDGLRPEPDKQRKNFPDDAKNLRDKVFFDKDNLSATQFAKTIQQQLDNSDHLLVLCSKYAARSIWVNKEIIYFLTREGKTLKDVSIGIIQGKPFAEGSSFDSIDTNEALPVSLRYEVKSLNLLHEDFNISEINATNYKEFLLPNKPLSADEINYIDFRKKHNTPEINKLISNITGIRKEEISNNNRSKYLVTSLLLGVPAILISSFFWWWNTTKHFNYYEDYYEDYLIPRGINKIDKNFTGYRPYIYKITESCGFIPFTSCRPQKVDRVKGLDSKNNNYTNFSGDDVESEFWLKDISSWTLEYNKKGQLSKRYFFTTGDKLKFRQEINISNKNTAEIKQSYGEIDNSKPYSLNSMALLSGRVTTDKPSISLGLITKNNNKKQQYTPNKDVMIHNQGKSESNTKAIKYDKHVVNTGLKAKSSYNPPSQQRKENSKEHINDKSESFEDRQKSNLIISKFHITFDKKGFIKKRIFKDIAESKNYSIDGVFGRAYFYDLAGRINKRCDLDKNKNKTICLELEHKVKNGSKKLIARWRVNSTNALTTNSNGIASYIREFKKKDNKTVETISYLGIDGARVLSNNSIHSIRKEYDQKGNLTRKEFFDTKNQPLALNNGIALIVNSYNREGSLIRKLFFDTEGKHTRHKEGNAGYTLTYYPSGKLKEKIFLGLDHKTPSNTKNGYAQITYEYDKKNQSKKCFFDKSGKATYNQYNYSCSKVERYSSGRIKKFTYFDIDGNKTPHTDGNASYLSTFDETGKIETRVFLGLNAERVFINGGYSKFIRKTTWDDKNERTVNVSYFGINDEPVLYDGYHQIIKKYNSIGRLYEERYFDINANSVSTHKGYARYENLYYPDGKLKEIHYYDSNNNLVMQDNGYAVKEIKRFSNNSHTIENYLDTSYKPTLHTKGFSIVEAFYNPQGKIVKEYLKDTKGNLIVSTDGYAIRKWSYDPVTGLLDHVDNFDAKSNPITLIDNYSGFKKVYNQKNLAIKYLYYKNDYKSRQLTKTTNGCSIKETGYDDRGYINLTRCFDKNGKEILNKDGFFMSKFRNNERGYPVEESYFDTKENPIIHPTLKYHHIIRKYDKKYQLVAESYYDFDNNPTLFANGFASVKYDYDKRGNLIDSRFFDKGGRPKITPEGYCRLKKQYDTRGNSILEEYYLKDHETLGIGPNGYAKVKRQFDYKKDKITIIAKTYDEKGNPINSLSGASVLKVIIHKLDNHRTYYLLDENNRSKIHEGYSIFSEKYDKYNRVTERQYFDNEMKLVLNKQGYALEEIEYLLDTDKITKITYHGITGKLINDETGISILKQEFDPKTLNLLKVSYFDSKKEPVLSTDNYAEMISKYNSKGKLLSKSYFDNHNNLINSLNGYAKYLVKYHPETGVLVEEEFLDKDQQYIIPKNKGFAKLIRILDKTSNTKIIRVKIYTSDKEERPIPPDLFKVAEYDDKGKNNSIIVTNEKWVPIMGLNDFSSVRFKRDKNDRVVEESYYDLSNNLVLHKSHKYAKEVRILDKRGNIKESNYFDEKNQKTLNKDGYATIKQKFDINNNIIEASYFDISGNSIPLQDGYAKFKSIFDQNNKVLSNTYFNKKDKLVNHGSLGYAFVKYKYHENGVIKEEKAYKASDLDHPYYINSYDKKGYSSKISYYDRFGNLSKGERGYAEYQTVYNDKGWLKSASYYDNQKKPINHPDLDYAHITDQYYGNGIIKEEKKYKANDLDHPYSVQTYDKKGYSGSLVYYNKESKRSEGNRGYAEYRTSFNDKGWLIYESYHNEKGELIDQKHQDYALVKKDYYEDGTLKQEKAYKEKNLEQPYYIQSYDKKGNQRKITYYDVKGKPSMGDRGYAEYRTKYTDNNMLVSESYFDEKGNSIVPKLFGYAKKENKYYKDSFMETEEAYFDESGKLMLQEGLGYAKVTYKIEGSNSILWKTDTRYYDNKNKLVKISEGYARLVKKLSKDKKFIETEQFIDEFGKLVNSKDGFAVIKYQNDQKSGNVLLKKYFDTQNNPVEDTQGIHSIRYSYKTNNDGTSYQLESYFNLRDDPVINKEKFATKKSTFNRFGLVISEKYLNKLGKPVLTAGGYSSAKYNYESPLSDDFVKYFDLFGKEVKPIGQCSVDVHK